MEGCWGGVYWCLRRKQRRGIPGLWRGERGKEEGGGGVGQVGGGIWGLVG